MIVEKTDGKVTSADGAHKVQYFHFRPSEGALRGVVLLLHGHHDRVKRFEDCGLISSLVTSGFAVCAFEYAGYGASVKSPSEHGAIKTMKHYAEDTARVLKTMKEADGSLPLILIGKGLGSCVARDFIAKYPSRASAAVLLGCVDAHHSASLGIFVCNLVSYFKSGNAPAPFMQKWLNYHYNSRLDLNEHLSDAWRANDTTRLRVEKKDGAKEHPMTWDGYYALCEYVNKTTAGTMSEKVPKDMRVLLLSGQNDPVGGRGFGVEDYKESLIDNGVKNVSMKLYPGARHEILFENCRDEVIADILAFLDRIVPTKEENGGCHDEKVSGD